MSKEHPLPTEHSPLPWGKNLEGEILDANGIYVCNYGSEHDGTLIEEACNNYHRLQSSLKEREEEVKQLRAENQRLHSELLPVYAKIDESFLNEKQDAQKNSEPVIWPYDKPLPPPPSKP